MVVQCEHCQTKYRIADEKVKGKGVKVRCAKCENVFTVTPPEIEIQAPAAQTPGPSPPAPEPPTPQPPTPVPPAPEPATPEFELDAGSSGAKGPEHGVSGEPPPSETVSDPFQASASLPPLPSLDGSQGPAVPDRDQSPPGPDHPEPGPPEASPHDRQSDGFPPPSPDLAPLDLGAQRPAHELDQTDLVSHPPEPSDPMDDSDLDDGGFEIEATLREDAAPDMGSPGADPGAGLPPLTQEAAPDGEWGNIPIDGQGAPEEGSGDFGLAGESGYTPPPPMPMEEPTEPPTPDQWEDDQHGTSTVPAYKPETGSSGGGKKAIILLLLLGALGAGGYFAYPTVMEMIQSRTQQTEGTLTPANIQVKALTRTDGKIIYSVRGEVRNDSQGNVGMIQVEAQFRNASGDVLRKASSFCGNMMPDSDLVRLETEKIHSNLLNELGQSLSNANIAPGQAVPFLVVLDNPPSGINKVTVTILSFQETT